MGCVNDVSNDYPHNKLLGTTWRLKVDAYVIEYNDNRGSFQLVPCSSELFSGLFPDRRFVYDEKYIGRSFKNKAVVAGLQKGDEITILRIEKDFNPELGLRIYPLAIIKNNNEYVDKKFLNLYWLYDGFTERGILNPKYAEEENTVHGNKSEDQIRTEDNQ